MSSVTFYNVTPEAEKSMAYFARVSNPINQDNPEYKKLFQHCIRKGHWSIFDMADMTVEITTTIGIAPQILRHKSFCFQQFSRRYSADCLDFEKIIPRRQDTKNRQSSIDDLFDDDKEWFEIELYNLNKKASEIYTEALSKGFAKESARFVLPQNLVTKLYMKGSVRSWITYLNVRLHKDTQKEHREIAEQIRDIFKEKFPLITIALNKFEGSYDDYFLSSIVSGK